MAFKFFEQDKVTEEKYLDGNLLCLITGVRMYQRIAIQVKKSGQIFGLDSDYFITPLGVAVRCSDGAGLFEVGRSKGIFDGEETIYKVFDEFISPKATRYSESWLENMALRAGIAVRTKKCGTVGTMEVPAVRFKKHQWAR